MESLAKIQAKREAKKDRRDKRKKSLTALSEKRIAVKGAPSHKVSESELLQFRMQIAHLTRANNEMAEILRRFVTEKIDERALEAYYMMQMLTGIIVEAGIATAEDIQRRSLSVQEAAMGVVEKANGVCEMGDVLIIKFSLTHNGDLVDDQTGAPMAYYMGSNNLSCERGFIGMRAGESRILDVSFGKGFKLPELVDKTLQMHVQCVAVRTSSPSPASAASG